MLKTKRTLPQNHDGIRVLTIAEKLLKGLLFWMKDLHKRGQAIDPNDWTADTATEASRNQEAQAQAVELDSDKRAEARPIIRIEPPSFPVPEAATRMGPKPIKREDEPEKPKGKRKRRAKKSK